MTPAYTNGYIPLTVQTQLGTFHYLPPAAARDLLGLIAQVKREKGVTLVLTSGWTGYRPYSEQVKAVETNYSNTNTGTGDWFDWNGKRWWRKVGFAKAAIPGTSNHGLGKAADIANWNAIPWAYFTQVCAVWGWKTGNVAGEGWHIEYTRDPWAASGSPAGEEQTMSDQSVAAAVWAVSVNRTGADGKPAPVSALQELADAKSLGITAPDRVWAVTVKRGDTLVPAIQELADAKSLGIQILAAIKAMGAPTGTGSLSDVDVAKIADAIAAKIPVAAIAAASAAATADLLAKRLVS